MVKKIIIKTEKRNSTGSYHIAVVLILLFGLGALATWSTADCKQNNCESDSSARNDQPAVKGQSIPESSPLVRNPSRNTNIDSLQIDPSNRSHRDEYSEHQDSTQVNNKKSSILELIEKTLADEIDSLKNAQDKTNEKNVSNDAHNHANHSKQAILKTTQNTLDLPPTGALSEEPTLSSPRYLLPKKTTAVSAQWISPTANPEGSIPLSSIQHFHQQVELPGCQSEIALVVQNANQLIAALTGNWQVICLKPGDYRAAGTLEIAVSGSSSEPRVLRSTLDSGSLDRFRRDSKVFMPPLEFNSVQHWTVDGLDWLHPATTAITAVDSLHLVVHRNHFQQTTSAIRVTGNSKHIALQGNWLNAKNADEGTCIEVDTIGYANDFRIVGNQLNHCKNSIRLNNREGALSYLIADNDLHNDQYKHCDTVGIEFLAAGVNGESSLVIGNRFSGLAASSTCNPLAIALHLGANSSHVSIEKNTIYNVNSAIQIAQGSHQIDITDNLISNTFKANSTDNNDQLAGVNIQGAATSVMLAHNHLIGSSHWLHSLDTPLQLSCNVILDGGTATGTSLSTAPVTKNSYFNTNPSIASATDGSDTHFAQASSANMSRACFDINQLANTTERCIESALRTSNSPQPCGSSYWEE